MKILIVDDKKENLILLDALLKGFGHEVEQAINGQEALQLLRRDAFQMVISDILMPVMDGYQLCREVRNDPNLKELLFIFYTATYTENDDEKLAYQLGADKYLVKPMAPDKFMGVIQSLIQDSEKKTSKSDHHKPAPKQESLKLYNERLVHKLEQKMMDLEKEIGEKKKAEAALTQSEEMFRKAFEYANIGKALTDPSGQFLKINESFCRMLGYTQDEVLHKNWRDITHPEFISDSSQILQRLLDGQIPAFTTEQQFVHKDGFPVWIRMNIVLVEDVKNRPLYLVQDVEDITERRNGELQIQHDLKEKEILLKEIHHRVRNNLQIIESLIHLQARRIPVEKEEIVGLLNELQTRFHAIALVHDQCYRSDNFVRIDFNGYIRNLTKDLSYRYVGRSRQIAVDFDFTEVFIPLDTAVPFGLVANELISNAFKHAFPESFEGSGKVEMTLRISKDNEVDFILKDNGVGLPADIDFKETKTLGLHLAKILSEDQLGGKISLERGQGTMFRVQFKLNNESPEKSMVA